MRKFRQERRKNIREQWQALAVSCTLTASTVIWLLLGQGWSRAFAAFLLGALITGLLFGWALGFDAHSLRWQWGAVGEQWTAEELKQLGPEWRVFHDIPDGTGNWDHIAIGPPGVFAIDSKNLSQPAKVDSNGLRAGRLRYGGSATRGSAVRLKELIQQQTGLSVWVQGVLAIWGHLPDGTTEQDKVLYVTASKLVETLNARPERLQRTQRKQVAAVIEDLAAT